MKNILHKFKRKLRSILHTKIRGRESIYQIRNKKELKRKFISLDPEDKITQW
jgi:hypothetical protein